LPQSPPSLLSAHHRRRLPLGREPKPAGAAWRSAGGDNPPIEKPAASPPQSRPSDAPGLGLTRLLVDWIMPSENPSGLVYGVIVIGALLAAESGRHESYLDTVASAVIAATLYWLAHAYATVLGRRLSSQEQLTARALSRP